MSFIGLCVGGPLAGKMHESNIGKFTTEAIQMNSKPLEISHEMAQALRATDVETVTYKWSAIRIGGMTFGLWLPGDTPIHEAINTIAEGYTRSVN